MVISQIFAVHFSYSNNFRSEFEIQHREKRDGEGTGTIKCPFASRSKQELGLHGWGRWDRWDSPREPAFCRNHTSR